MRRFGKRRKRWGVADGSRGWSVGQMAVRPRRPVFETLEPRRVLDSTVVFSEIMYHPPDDQGDALEWIELHNQLAVDMDVSQWSLAGGVDYTFPDGSVVPGRGYVVVAADPAALAAESGYSDAWGPFSGQLDNAGETLQLWNNDGRLMNQVEYRDGGAWPVGPDGSGATLAKREAHAASEPAANWTWSPELGGTPGAANFAQPGTLIIDTLMEAGTDVRAWVPSDGGLGTTWTGGSEPFDDAAWLQGTTGVGYDNNGDYDSLLGLDLDAPPDGQTPMTMYNVNQTVYLRVPFQLDTDVDQFDSVLLRMQYDDGFVAYLNGVQVASALAPSAPSWNSGSTGSRPDSQAQAFEEFDITLHRDVLVEGGQNILAIQGMNHRLGSSDLLLVPEIIGAREQQTGPVGYEDVTLVINEVAAGSDASFWLEIANRGDRPIDLEGFVLTASGATGGQYVFPAQSLAPGGLRVVTEAELGFAPVAGNKLFLYTPAQEYLIDGQVVTNRLRGQAERYAGRWLFPDSATPGAANQFAFHDEIVINEIMYHAFPQLATETQPYAESPEEWIELTNRGSTTVDLGGWSLDDAIGYQFDAGTLLAPGDYLVVANDSVALAAKYPSISIVGDFSGRLSNRDERIQLKDSDNNPADEVHYFEAGRWSGYADGGGSSLELRSPDADNSIAEAWAASDEAGKSNWRTYTFRGTANEPLSCCSGYNEFILGLLDEGEVLIDDVSVVRDPDGSATEMIQNGTFEGDAVGQAPAHWRLIGTHGGRVDDDPDDPGNHVLHLVTTGPQGYVHDHAETTFVGNTPVSSSAVYEVSLRAKWIAGNSQLNNRLYFTRNSNTMLLEVPDRLGTPGGQNSVFEANLGPTYRAFSHGPVTPLAGQAVTVSVEAEDPQGVDSMALWWRRDGSAWNSVAMSGGADGIYSGTISGQSSGSVVQFYVEGQDALGARSTYPAAGAESRALYEVDDGQRTTRPIDTIRLVLRTAENSQLFSSANRMSNNYVGGTVVRSNEEVFYDIGIRQVGSRFVRPNSGYRIRLNSEHRFDGVHDSIRLDFRGVKEIVFKQMVNRAGGSEVSLYDDIAMLISPQHGSRTTLLNLARYEGIFLDEQFEDGASGTKFELDDITYPTDPNPAPEGLKTGTGVSSQDMRYRGDDKENYRGHLLIKNQRAKDEFAPLIAMSEAIQLSGQALYDATQEVMDVDLWMRHYATQSFLGNWDTYGFRRPKNLRIYIRPSDGKVIPLYWDADLANLTESLIYNGGMSRLDEMRDLPANLRLFWGHMLDLMDRSFNADYIAPWAAHYATLSGENYSGEVSKIASRVTTATAQLNRAIPKVPFQITTNGGNDLTVDENRVTLAGDGWIDVRTLRVSTSSTPLEVTWTDSNSWQVTVPVGSGENQLTFEALDYQGQLTGVASITVVSTSPDPLVADALRITELMYHPTAATAAELAAGFTDGDDFEFIELANISERTINLEGVALTAGVQFAFGSVSMEPGQQIVVVQNQAAFAARYGTGIDVAGEFASGKLNNGGEQLVLRDPFGRAIHDFVYDDSGDWPARADGHGSSLEVTAVAGDYRDADNWHASDEVGGSPGWDGNGVTTDVIVNEVLSRGSDGSPDQIELVNTTDAPVDVSGWYLSDDVDAWAQGRLPAGTLIPSGGYLVVTAAEVGLDLDGVAGDDLWLIAADRDTGRPRRFADQVAFAGSDTGVSLGRYLDGDPGSLLFPMTQLTFGAANSGPAVGDVRIAEVHYHPGWFREDFESGTAAGFTPVMGTWEVSEGRYVMTPGPEGDTVSTISALGTLPDRYRIQATVKVLAADGLSKNGAIIFDYRGPTDFKFAMARAGADRWQLGQRDAEGWMYLAALPESIATGADYRLSVEIDGSVATLVVDGIAKTTYDFGAPLRAGLVGVGSNRGSAQFDEIRVEPIRDSEYEFVELTNTAAEPVSLSGWQLADAVRIAFQPGTTIAGGGTLVVVGFDPADGTQADAFRAEFGIDQSVTLTGPYTGNLRNSGDTVELMKPVETTGGLSGLTLVDRVNYDDELPWPTDADGRGQSLQRVSADAYGDFAASWIAAPPTPGTTQFGKLGDLNGDGQVNGLDVDPFVTTLLTGPYNGLADMNQDGVVNGLDVDPFTAAVVGGRGVAVEASAADLPTPGFTYSVGLQAATPTEPPAYAEVISGSDPAARAHARNDVVRRSGERHAARRRRPVIRADVAADGGRLGRPWRDLADDALQSVIDWRLGKNGWR